MANINVQGFLDSLSSRQQGSAEEDLLAQRLQSISEDIYTTASASKQPFKTSLATAMGDTLGKGLLRAFNVKDTERQRAIDTDQANKLLAELQKKPMTSKNLMEMASLYQSQNQQESAIRAITLAREIDQQTAEQATTATQKVNVANQALAAGFPDLADRIADQTLTPQEGLAEILKRQKEEADKKAASAAASAAASKEKVVIIDGENYLFNESTGNIRKPVLPEEIVEAQEEEAEANIIAGLVDLDAKMKSLDEIEDLAINKGAAGSGYELYSKSAIISELVSGAGTFAQYTGADLGNDETGSPYELRALLKPLQSDVVMSAINKLKSQSKTGATGLGPISNIEINLLQNSLAALDPAIGEEAFKEQLAKVRMHYTNVKDVLLGKPPKIDIESSSYDAYVKKVMYKGKERVGLRIGETYYLRDIEGSK